MGLNRKRLFGYAWAAGLVCPECKRPPDAHCPACGACGPDEQGCQVCAGEGSDDVLDFIDWMEQDDAA